MISKRTATDIANRMISIGAKEPLNVYASIDIAEHLIRYSDHLYAVRDQPSKALNFLAEYDIGHIMRDAILDPFGSPTSIPDDVSLAEFQAYLIIELLSRSPKYRDYIKPDTDSGMVEVCNLRNRMAASVQEIAA